VTIFVPEGRPTVEWLFLDADTPDTVLANWLGAALAHCAWNSHVVVTGGDTDGLLLDTVVRFLENEPLALVHFHLVAPFSLDGSPAIERLLDAAEAFQTEAYRERTGSRLFPLPILEVGKDVDPRPAIEKSGEMRARLAKPSLLMWDEPGDRASAVAEALGMRIYLGSKTTTGGTMEILTDAHILDGALARLNDPDTLLGPCWTHQVIGGGRMFACARQWRRGLPRTSELGTSVPEWQPDEALCASCIADTMADQGPSLAANRRHAEGRELALRTSAALTEREPGAAAAVAATAIHLSTEKPERIDALIQTGLCLTAAGRLGDADRALVDASRLGAGPGLINLHRARVQVAWRDDIEALDRYEEALELGTDAISVEDLHFEMALSHIRLEEWSEARTHLEQSGGPSAAIAFNLGVCDVNSGDAERALAHFDNALELEPPDDDLGRVRFFRGYSLKELERFDEAADDLRLAIELEEPESAHHNLLGFCLFKLGRHAEAVICFEAAVALDPASATDWANIGVNLERLGESDRAAEMYRKALGMDRSIDFAKAGLERLKS